MIWEFIFLSLVFFRFIAIKVIFFIAWCTIRDFDDEMRTMRKKIILIAMMTINLNIKQTVKQKSKIVLKKMINCGFDYILDIFYSRLRIWLSLLVSFVEKWDTPAKPLFSSFESSSRMLWLTRLSWIKVLNFYLFPVAEVIRS